MIFLSMMLSLTTPNLLLYFISFFIFYHLTKRCIVILKKGENMVLFIVWVISTNGFDDGNYRIVIMMIIVKWFWSRQLFQRFLMLASEQDSEYKSHHSKCIKFKLKMLYSGIQLKELEGMKVWSWSYELKDLKLWKLA